MRIKHYQGYGSVNMKVLKNSLNLVVIEVTGMHEWGLDTYDKDRACEWLLNRVKQHKDKTYRDIFKLDVNDDYVKDSNGLTIEKCTYTFTLR